MAEQRVGVAPQVPTFREQGLDVTIGSLRGFVGPKGIPPEMTARLGEAIEAVFADPAFVALAARTQQPLRLLRQAEYTRHLHESDAKFRGLWASRPWV